VLCVAHSLAAPPPPICTPQDPLQLIYDLVDLAANTVYAQQAVLCEYTGEWAMEGVVHVQLSPAVVDWFYAQGSLSTVMGLDMQISTPAQCSHSTLAPCHGLQTSWTGASQSWWATW
jgi:hypothetical protein